LISTEKIKNPTPDHSRLLNNLGSKFVQIKSNIEGKVEELKEQLGDIAARP